MRKLLLLEAHKHVISHKSSEEISKRIATLTTPAQAIIKRMVEGKAEVVHSCNFPVSTSRIISLRNQFLSHVQPSTARALEKEDAILKLKPVEFVRMLDLFEKWDIGRMLRADIDPKLVDWAEFNLGSTSTRRLSIDSIDEHRSSESPIAKRPSNRSNLAEISNQNAQGAEMDVEYNEGRSEAYGHRPSKPLQYDDVTGGSTSPVEQSEHTMITDEYSDSEEPEDFFSDLAKAWRVRRSEQESVSPGTPRFAELSPELATERRDRTANIPIPQQPQQSLMSARPPGRGASPSAPSWAVHPPIAGADGRRPEAAKARRTAVVGAPRALIQASSLVHQRLKSQGRQLISLLTRRSTARASPHLPGLKYGGRFLHICR